MKSGSSSKFIAIPLDENSPLPFIDSLPSQVPRNTLIPYASYMTRNPHEYLMCALQHSATISCASNIIPQFQGEFGRALQLYLPLNLVILEFI